MSSDLPVSSSSTQLPAVFAFEPSIPALFQKIFNHPEFVWGIGVSDDLEEKVGDTYQFVNTNFMFSKMFAQHREVLFEENEVPIVYPDPRSLPKDVTQEGLLTPISFETLVGMWYINHNVNRKHYEACFNYLFGKFPDQQFDLATYFGLDHPAFPVTPRVLYALVQDAIFMGKTATPPNIGHIFIKTTSEMFHFFHKELVRRESIPPEEVNRRYFSGDNLTAIQGALYASIDFVLFTEYLLTRWVNEVGMIWSINKDQYIK